MRWLLFSAVLLAGFMHGAETSSPANWNAAGDDYNNLEDYLNSLVREWRD